MTVLFVLVPLALGIAASAVIAFLWAAKNGQLDDLETPALRMLQDDEPAPRRAADAPPSPPPSGTHSTS